MCNSLDFFFVGEHIVVAHRYITHHHLTFFKMHKQGKKSNSLQNECIILPSFSFTGALNHFYRKNKVFNLVHPS